MRNLLRLGVLAAAVTLSLASSGSNRNARNQQGPPPSVGANGAPVRSQPMAQSAALGLWKSSFGAVKVEADPSRPGNIRGVWLYDRNGKEVIGYFAGALSGNTLSFSWEEPTTSGPPLEGGGYLVFDPRGQSFEGKWWTTSRDRGGDWSGWRFEAGSGGPAEQAPDQDADPNDDPNAPPPAEPPPLPGTETI